MKTITNDRIGIDQDNRFPVSVPDISIALESVDSQEIISIEFARPLGRRIYPKELKDLPFQTIPLCYFMRKRPRLGGQEPRSITNSCRIYATSRKGTELISAKLRICDFTRIATDWLAHTPEDQRWEMWCVFVVTAPSANGWCEVPLVRLRSL